MDARKLGYAVVRHVVQALEPSDFEGGVEAGGQVWDVYRFVYEGMPGQLAVAIVDGCAAISYFRHGRRSLLDIASEIERVTPSDWVGVLSKPEEALDGMN